MLLKNAQAEKKLKANGAGKQQRGAGTMKLIVGAPLPPRPHRRSAKGFGAKRPAVTQSRTSVTGGREIRGFGVDPCENSNDSGLGFDHHLDYPLPNRSTLKPVEQETSWSSDHPETKRKKLDIKLESDDARDNFGFSETMSRGRKDMHIPPSLLAPAAGEAGRAVSSMAHNNAGGMPRTVQRPPPSRPLALTSSRTSGPISLSTQLTNVSHDGRTHLQILCQPEQQHRARYQTEGSRGAVKDRSGNGFPIVRLVGYNKPAVMQVYIGTDVGRVAPHMFYQACRVSGKNSTPCVERKIDGTIVIEVDFDPAKEMTITCDCVGILKERNVDVEHRFPDQSGTRNKKKSTRCRMIFRTTITHDDGSTEVLQTASQPIVCTQPPGVPEICKKSMTTCPCTGGVELFILGKNFLKDSRVLFQHNETDPTWEESVQPDKEYLQQTHLVCTVPPYRRVDISEPVTVKLLVMSSGKTSEPHTFTYLPTTNPVVAAALQAPAAGATHLGPPCIPAAHPSVATPMELSRAYGKSSLSSSSAMRLSGQQLKSGTDFSNLKNQFMSFGNSRGSTEKDVHPTVMWQSSSGSVGKEEKKQLPPALVPIGPRRTAGVQLIIPDMHVPELKTEVLDESSQSSPNQLSPEDLKGIDLRTKPITTVSQLGSAADLSGTPSPSMTTFQRFVSRDTYMPLPSQTGQSVEKYLSHLEGGPNNPKDASQQLSAYKMSSSCSTNTSSTAAATCQGLSGEKSLTSFNTQPLLFDTTQQQSLLTSRHVIQQPSQKIGFVGDIALASLYERPDSSEKPDKRHKSPIPEEAIVRTQSVEESVSQSQSLQEALSQTRTLQEAFSQSQTLEEAFSQSQTLQKTFTQPQTLQEAITHSQSLQEVLTRSQSLQEAMVQSHTLSEAAAQQQTLQQAVTAAQSLQEAVAQSQSIQQAIAGSQSSQIQEAIAQNQLMALTNLTSPPISDLCNQQANVTLTSRNHISEVPESQVNKNLAAENYHSNTLQRTANETPMNMPEMINALPESGVMIPTPTTIVFRSSQESIARDTVCLDSKTDEQMMDGMNNNLESGSHTAVSGHSSPVLNAQVPAGNGVLSMETSPRPTDRGLVNQEQSSLMSTAGLEALVSSAMDSHMTSATEKLDAIVNSAADSHMANRNTSVTTVSDILNSRVSVGLSDQGSRGDPQQSSVLTLDSSINSVRDLNTYNMRSLQTGQQPVQITQESIILNNAVSAAIDEHLRRQDAEQKDASVADQCTLMNTTQPNTTSGLSIVTPSTTDSILLKSPHISPIAVKKMMLDTPASVAVDRPALITSANSSSPVAVKHIKLSTPPSEPEMCLSSSNVTSQTVTESNIRIQVPDCSSTIAVKDIINSHTRVIAGSNSEISPSVTLNASNSRINILETNSCLPSGAAVEMHAHSLSSLLNSNNNSTLVTDNSQMQNQSLALTQSSSITSENLQTQAHLTNSTTPVQDVQNQNEVRGGSQVQPSNAAEPVMVQHTSLLNSMYTSVPNTANVNYSTSSTMAVDGCPVTVAQIASLNSIAHSTDEIPQNPTLQTDTIIPSKAVESTDSKNSSGAYLLIGLSTNEKERLQTSVGQPPAGNYSVSDHKVFNSETKPGGGSNLNGFSRTASSLECTEATNQQHKVPTVTQLPVPVAEISSAATQAKGLATSSTAPKKCEEGMVPQELTQMSESDLISYINPSCFDQV